MIYGLYQSAAGLLTNEYRQSVISNNLANASTPGFKRDVAVFAERRAEWDGGDRSGPSDETVSGLSGGLWLGATQTDFSFGSFQQSDNPLDVALDGSGFLAVEKNGRTLYTRDGRMVRDANGYLRAASDGAAMLSDAGRPIVLNPRGGAAHVDESGDVWQDGGRVGRLGLFDFANYRALQKTGASRFDAGGQAPTRAQTTVHGGVVEDAAVEPVKELVNLIEASRAYQLNAQMLTLQDQTAGRMIGLVATG